MCSLTHGCDPPADFTACSAALSDTGVASKGTGGGMAPVTIARSLPATRGQCQLRGFFGTMTD